MRKILYLDCASGISGDMTVGALLDILEQAGKTGTALDSLGVSGNTVFWADEEMWNGCAISYFDVHLEEEEHHHDHLTNITNLRT